MLGPLGEPDVAKATGKRDSIKNETRVLAQVSPHVAFYLDRARHYEAAFQQGRSDTDIAQAADLSPRTVRWYRRLAAMPPECEALILAHPKVFDATWAMSVARRGPLPPLAVLLKSMREQMTKRQQAKAKRRPPTRRPASSSEERAASSRALRALRTKMNGDELKDLSAFVRQFLQLLVKSDLLNEADRTRIDNAIWPGRSF